MGAQAQRNNIRARLQKRNEADQLRTESFVETLPPARASVECPPCYVESTACNHALECPELFSPTVPSVQDLFRLVDFADCCEQCGEKVQFSACNYDE